MKNIINILAIILLSYNVGCKDSFLDRKPSEAVLSSSVFETTESAMTTLNGIHRLLYYRMDPPNSQGSFGEGTIKIISDYMGEDIVRNGGRNWFSSAHEWRNHINPTFTHNIFVYKFYYVLILNANEIINHVDEAIGPQADKNLIKAEALCYRAHSYFQLVQLYGKRYDANSKPNTQLGVPLILELTLEGQPREEVEKIYTQIHKDLDEAITLFETASASPNKSHFNKLIAKGLKARVSLAQSDWSSAASLATEVIESNDYKLMDSTKYTAGFNSVDNDEWIWGSKHITDQTTYFAGFFAYMSHNFSSTFIRGYPNSINKELYNAFPATDARRANFAVDGLEDAELPRAGSRSVPYQSRKFTAQSPSISVGDVPHMRLGEMYLIQAEAYARANDNTKAADALYTLNRARDPKYVKSTKTGAALITEIMLSRRFELWGEGFRFFDLKRLNQPLQRTAAQGHNSARALKMEVPAGDILWEFLFPQDEVNANSKLVQNPS